MKKLPQTATIKIILFLLFGIIIVLSIFFLRKLNVNQPVIPGTSKLGAVIGDAQPFAVKTEGKESHYLVGSQTSSNYTEYVASSGTLDYYIQKNPADFAHSTIDEYLAEYGPISLELFGPWYQSGGYKSYVFLKAGLIIIAHPKSKAATEVWHIPPNLSKEGFGEKFGSQFSPIRPPPTEAF